MKNSFSNMSFEELVTEREKLKKQYVELKFKKTLSHIENPLLVRTLRRQIARLYTRERELVLKESKSRSSS